MDTDQEAAPSSAADRERAGGANGASAAMEAAAEALQQVELVNVVPVEIFARSAENAAPASGVKVQVDAEMHRGVGALGNRFRYEIDMVDDDDATVATLRFVLQVEYDVEPDYEVTLEAAEYLTNTTGLFAAYPYARELAQNLATRLQQDPLVLGLLPRGATEPASVNRVVRRAPAPPPTSLPEES